MFPDERRTQLLELIHKTGFAGLGELANSLGVSESTVRRDLEVLEHKNAIRRTHGGAVAANEPVPIPAFEARSLVAVDQKRAIAATTAKLIRDGETILLDGGSTTFEFARMLLGRQIQVITNSLPIGQRLACDRGIELTMIGGTVHPRTGVALGPIACQCLERLHARRLIMSVAGINERGLFNSNALLIETERLMMRAAEEVIVVADHSKFGHQSLAHLCELRQVHRIVSDAGLADSYRELVRQAGVELLIAGSESEGAG